MERSHLKNLGVDGNTLKLILQKQGVDWGHLKLSKDQWRAFVSTGMKFLVP
jgi:hypothetical protein